MEAAIVKQELVDRPNPNPNPNPNPPVIDLSSSSSGSDSEVEDGGEANSGSGLGKRAKVSDGERSDKGKKHKSALPLGFLDPLPPENGAAPAAPLPVTVVHGSRQFWKAGDYDGSPIVEEPLTVDRVGMDHVRVHPKFLHSNATSHKWALGAFAELLDNSLDEVCSGATYVNIDVLQNKKDGTKMLLIEDNGGGMDPDKMRKCMSLGYSAKSKIANTIGQYGNGFKTSTMRLGADVVVFSRSRGKDGKRCSCSNLHYEGKNFAFRYLTDSSYQYCDEVDFPTQSVGMLSYTFLRNTGKEDIVVPMLDYEKKGHVWHKMTRSSSVDWDINIETIVQWSPYSSEADLLNELNSMSDQGTRIVIYNLWEDDQGELELDFDTDKHDIQLGGVNRDEKKIEMAVQFPNSRHFLTYRHSLRSYASILYLRLPCGFRMVLRGKEIEHHNIVNDMMLKDTVHYRPQPGDGVPKDPNVVAVVTMGFVKDAKHHIDVQGFNVYHKNRLIKPFWRVWNAAGSDGRGVIGVLEANFVEPAHDKQGFERTTVLSRLEHKLIQMQKTYWSTNCHKIGYAPRRNKKNIALEERESSPEVLPSSWHSGKDASVSGNTPVRSRRSTKSGCSDKSFSYSNKTGKIGASPYVSVRFGGHGNMSAGKFEKQKRSERSSLHGSPLIDDSDSDTEYIPTRRSIINESVRPIVPHQKSLQKEKGTACPSLSTSPYSINNEAEINHTPDVESAGIASRSQSKSTLVTCNAPSHEDSLLQIEQLIAENETLKQRIMKIEGTMLCDLQQERDKNALLAKKLEDAKKRLEEANKEQEALVDVFAEERSRRDKEEENLRSKLRDASRTIQELLDKLSSSRSN